MDEQANSAAEGALPGSAVPESSDGEQQPDEQPQRTDPRSGIEEAVAGLDGLADLPLSEHVERFEAVHTELTVALSSIDKV